MATLAVDIFEMIFEQAPDAKLMFTFMMRDNSDDEKKSSEFAFHALRFMQVIETTMEHLEDPLTLDPLLANLGQIHARHEEHLGFRFFSFNIDIPSIFIPFSFLSTCCRTEQLEFKKI
ncbi:globin [Ostertagia ostertagi]